MTAADSGVRTGRFSFVRGLTLSDYLTMANGLGGAGAVLAVLGYMASDRPALLAVAMALYPICLAMDFLDGRVARARGKSSPLGADLDSLADVVSFGVAPAAIGFAAGLRGGWDVIPLLFMVACAIGRLARYNVTSAALADESGKVRYFEGVPVTGSLLVVAVLAASALTGHLGAGLPLGAHRLGPFVLHPLALAYLVVGCGMVSKRLHIPKP
ncbi:MAG TPA: CDP-alcohol phosphatidyltransferase family protein [Polyangia bacterium]|nr:CDP-alcohol phosphatidyltransferase family protein [Polyangia bacterium]